MTSTAFEVAPREVKAFEALKTKYELEFATDSDPTPHAERDSNAEQGVQYAQSGLPHRRLDSL